MIPELHRPVPLDRISPNGSPNGTDVLVEATTAECAALAERMGLPGVVGLTCRFHLTREGGQVTARGHLKARVMQTCVVSLDDFETTVEERFRVRFVPSGKEEDSDDPETDDEIPYEGTQIDIGEAAAEQLGLALDPYPRKPDAVLPEAATEAETNPFAALAALKRTQ